MTLIHCATCETEIAESAACGCRSCGMLVCWACWDAEKRKCKACVQEES